VSHERSKQLKNLCCTRTFATNIRP
jgi:hypothetical protein